ncbi:MAG: GNAT family N-acetyltransferase [Candidatus Babeliales bacterium]|nr:GNAT family N-acetyltransferase [Candidatus Babeliales bacterium]
MIIRKFQKSDAQKVGQLFYDTVHTVNAQDYAPELINMWAPDNDEFTRLVSACENNVFFVAERDAIIMGFGDMTHEGHLERLFVHKDFQGQRIGTLLLQAIEDAAYDIGLMAITTEASVRAMPFFTSHGFQTIRILNKKHPYKGLVFTTYKMKKILI